MNEKTCVQRILKKALRDEGGFPQNGMRSFVKIFAVVVVMEHKEVGLVHSRLCNTQEVVKEHRWVGGSIFHWERGYGIQYHWHVPSMHQRWSEGN